MINKISLLDVANNNFVKYDNRFNNMFSLVSCFD